MLETIEPDEPNNANKEPFNVSSTFRKLLAQNKQDLHKILNTEGIVTPKAEF